MGPTTATLRPGAYVAFRGSSAVIGEAREGGVSASGTVRTSSYAGESRTVMVDVADSVALTVAVPDAADAATYRQGGTEVRFTVPEAALVVLDR